LLTSAAQQHQAYNKQAKQHQAYSKASKEVPLAHTQTPSKQFLLVEELKGAKQWKALTK